ncbi:MAG: DUF4276 family protein, partial [Terriglobia bacterium]
VYVEGGGDRKKISDDCRRGFGQLFEKMAPVGQQPKVIACGGRSSAFETFQRDYMAGKEGFLILLVDSEGPVGENETAWQYLHNRQHDAWQQPDGTVEDQAQLMVQCMESWFLADKEKLKQYYGQRFLPGSLPGQTNIEEIPKQDVEQALKHASRNTQKGAYHKTRHGFELLELLDPARLRAASRRARILFEMLETRSKM